MIRLAASAAADGVIWAALRGVSVPPGVDFDVHLVTDLEMGELKQRGIENDPLRVADLGDGLDHGFTKFYAMVFVKP